MHRDARHGCSIRLHKALRCGLERFKGRDENVIQRISENAAERVGERAEKRDHGRVAVCEGGIKTVRTLVVAFTCTVAGTASPKVGVGRSQIYKIDPNSNRERIREVLGVIVRIGRD